MIDTAKVTLSCPCHVGGGQCQGGIVLTFPFKMFETSGAVEYHLHRSKFISEMTAVYDKYAQSARDEAVKMNPETKYPELSSMVKVDVSAIERAITEDVDEVEGME